MLPERGIVIVMGPNMSGKSLLVASLGAAATAYLLTSDGRTIGTLAERLIDEVWSESYTGVVDPLEYLSSIPEIEYRDPKELLRRLDEIIAKGGALNTKSYLRRAILAAELCLSRGVAPWGERRYRPFTVKISLKGPEGELRGYIVASLPGPDVKVQGTSALSSSVDLMLPEGLWGLNVGVPDKFLRMCYASEEKSPAASFIKALMNVIDYSPPSRAYDKLLDLLLVSWKEISGYEVDRDDVVISKRGVEGPWISIGGVSFPWKYTSEGVMNLLAHWLILKILPLFKEEGRRPLIAFEEPESHLDPYAAYLLPQFYAELIKYSNAIIILSTHSEMLVKGLEDAVAKNVLSPEEVKVYETRGKYPSFTLVECRVREEGYVEESRLTKIAERLISGELP